MSAWYLDDGTLVGTRATLAAVLEELNGEDTKRLGLELNMKKTEVWWPLETIPSLDSQKM